MAYSRDTGTGHDITTDAGFRAWATGVHNVLSACGLVQTSDTGQINLATVTTPATNGTFGGYEIWRFSDAAQSTDPIFIRVDYGRGNAVSYAGLKLQVGTGSNGSGTLTGASTASGTTSSTVNTAASGLIYGCFSDSALILVESGNLAGANQLFIVERTRNSSGALIAGRWLFVTSIGSIALVQRSSTGSWSNLSLNGVSATHPTGADTEGRKRLGVIIIEGDNALIAMGVAKDGEVGSGDTGTMRINGSDRTYLRESFSSTGGIVFAAVYAANQVLIATRPLFLQQ